MILEAIALGLVVAPYSSLLGSIVAAVLITRAKSAIGYAVGGLVLVAAWLLGEGLFRLSVTQGAAGPDPQRVWLLFGVQALVSLGFGYVLPTWAGYFVGKRVIRGTGWISAGVVAASAAGAVYAIGSSLAARL